MKKRKNILIAVAGLSPQVITETLYFLTQESKPPVSVSEILVITTWSGKRIIEKELLDPSTGMYHRFCRDYSIEPGSIKFDESSFVLLRDKNGDPLEDIRKADDNRLVADQIAEFIKKQTERPDTALHCSVAGGRKTMSVYLAYAMMLFGRPQDTLSHVLVDDGLESDGDFYYPLRSELKTKRVELAEIPFPRLRNKITGLMRSLGESFSNFVKTAQKEIDQMLQLEPLVIDLKHRMIIIGEKDISLTPKQLAIYCYFAQRRKKLSAKNSFIALKGPDSLQGDLHKVREIIMHIIPGVDVNKYKFTADNLLQDISKINRRIDEAIDDPSFAIHYRITTDEPGKRTYGSTRYGIAIEKSRIEIRK